MVFKEQDNKGIGVWRGEFTNLRVPKLFELRADPFERGDESILYEKWQVGRAFIFVPAQALVAQWLESFKEFPIRQKQLRQSGLGNGETSPTRGPDWRRPARTMVRPSSIKAEWRSSRMPSSSTGIISSSAARGLRCVAIPGARGSTRALRRTLTSSVISRPTVGLSLGCGTSIPFASTAQRQRAEALLLGGRHG